MSLSLSLLSPLPDFVRLSSSFFFCAFFYCSFFKSSSNLDITSAFSYITLAFFEKSDLGTLLLSFGGARLFKDAIEFFFEFKSLSYYDPKCTDVSISLGSCSLSSSSSLLKLALRHSSL